MWLHVKEDPVVADAKPSEAKKPEDKPEPKAPLGRASESGDPAVHKALADLQTARMNRAVLADEDPGVGAADEEVDAAQRNLTDLGYE
jgi:hypothetical protein